MGKKKKASKSLLILVIILFLLIAAAMVVMAFSQRDTGDSEGYFVTEEAASDGAVLTDDGVMEYFGIDEVSQVMSIYLKDTGDCGIFFIDRGISSVWKETKDGIIEIHLGDGTLKLQKNWDGLIFKKKHQGKEIVIKLKKANSKPQCFVDHPELTFGVDFTSKDRTALCNFMQDGHYLIEDRTILGKFFEKNKAGFGYGKISDSDGKLNVSDIKFFEKKGQAKFVVKEGSTIYYLWAPADGSTESIKHVDIETGKVQVLREGDADYFQLRFGKLYFTNENHRFCRMDLNGKNEEVVLDKEVYMPYVIDNGWLVYQNDGDGETLHMTYMGSDYDITLSRERTYAWTIDGRNLFYTSTGEKEDELKHRCKLHKINLLDIKSIESASTLPVESANKYMGDSFEINASDVFGGDGSHMEIDSWKNYSNNLYKAENQENYLMYLSEEYMIREKFTPVGLHKETLIKNLKTEDESVL